MAPNAKKTRWLPREGFTADVVVEIFKKTVLAPSVTLPLLLLARYTAKGRDVAHDRPRLFQTLQILVAVGLVRWVNNWLNRKALNNWVSDKYDWSKEIVVLTGGSDGIGQRIAMRLALRGVKVAVLDIQPLKYRAHPNIKYFKCNVTSPDEIAEAATQIRARLGEPTVLINNAGILRGKTVLAATEADIRLTFEVNTLAHYWLAREFLPHMVTTNHGMVVTVASQAAYVNTPTMVDYGASKSAALAFHEALASELKTRYHAPKVRSVVITQGFSRTHLTDVLAPRDTWLNPYLHADTVAELLVNQILKGESGYINVPQATGLIAANIRSLPLWFQHGLRVRLNELTQKPTVKWG
ncbi:hypothetical protein VTO42DRAFT_913 [Malbranchea cinnamomea]